MAIGIETISGFDNGIVHEGLGDLTSDLASAFIKGVNIESAWLPAMSLSANDIKSSSGQPSFVGSLLKPKITLTLTNGSPVTIMPYGEPGPSRWPLLALGAGVVSLLAIYGLFKLVRR